MIDDILGSIVICTSHGPVTAAGDGQSSPRSTADHCPACTLLSKIVLVLTVILAAIAFPAPLSVRPIPVRARSLPVHLSLGGIRSRAPPLSA